MRILLTGSTGWLGRVLAPRLAACGHSVTGLDVAPGAHTQVIGSVADRDLVERTFAARGFDAVVHAGALHKPDIARFPAQRFVDVNVAGTLNLLEASVRCGAGRFVMTSTTSLMISHALRSGASTKAVWLDETFGPLEPRNIYGVTKLAAEGLCRMSHLQDGLAVVILRTSRFFPEDDDTLDAISGPNLKANELLFRRLTVEDAADAHLAALDRAAEIGFGLYIVSAPPPFTRDEADALVHDAASVVARHFPDAPALYARRGWRLPDRIDRVYDPSRMERELGFRCRAGFGSVLRSLRDGKALPFVHDAAYVSPSTLTQT